MSTSKLKLDVTHPWTNILFRGSRNTSLIFETKKKERKKLVKFRIGNYKSRIETGRLTDSALFVNPVKLKMHLTFQLQI